MKREERIAFIYITLGLNWDLKQLFKNDCMFWILQFIIIIIYGKKAYTYTHTWPTTMQINDVNTKFAFAFTIMSLFIGNLAMRYRIFSDKYVLRYQIAIIHFRFFCMFFFSFDKLLYPSYFHILSFLWNIHETWKLLLFLFHRHFHLLGIFSAKLNIQVMRNNTYFFDMKHFATCSFFVMIILTR